MFRSDQVKVNTTKQDYSEKLRSRVGQTSAPREIEVVKRIRAYSRERKKD